MDLKARRVEAEKEKRVMTGRRKGRSLTRDMVTGEGVISGD